MARVAARRPTPDSAYYVIEVNPRVSRSSALASKATGYPIARVAAKIAAGQAAGRDPQRCDTARPLAALSSPRSTTAWYEDTPLAFRQVPHAATASIGTQMKATGEVMAIDRSFEAAFQKAVRSLEITNRSILWEDAGLESAPENGGRRSAGCIGPTTNGCGRCSPSSAKGARARRSCPADHRHRLRGSRGPSIRTSPTWKLRSAGRATWRRELLWRGEADGLFGDEKIGLCSPTARVKQVARSVHEWDHTPRVQDGRHLRRRVRGSDALLLQHLRAGERGGADARSAKALVVGSGPIRIGQGIEFDYCSVHAAWALDEEGIESVMVNSNPETVSTDFDTSDRLYFEPLDEESVRDILENEATVTDGRRDVVSSPRQ